MGNIENAFIQQNNIRWINQKAMEGGDRPKPELKPTIEFMSNPYYDTGDLRRLFSGGLLLGECRLLSSALGEDFE